MSTIDTQLASMTFAEILAQALQTEHAIEELVAETLGYRYQSGYGWVIAADKHAVELVRELVFAYADLVRHTQYGSAGL